ncbi:MAG: hypothetical protein VYA62_03200 [Planctomycetota bacterium]|nr:hypothetical protein [Planctomycetota bacterium]
MLRGTLALMTRGLRLDCRRWQMHALRFLLVAIFLFMLLLAWVENVVSIGATPGLNFFSYITYTNFAFITLGGMSFFTSSITEEKEEQTLGLLKMAGVNPLGILLGKLGPRLLNALLLLAIQFPFVQLAVTLGGVHSRQIQAAYITLAGYILLMAGLGILASVIARRTRQAALMICMTILIPLILQVFLSILGAGGTRFPQLTIASEAIQWISVWSVAQRLSEVMSLGFDGAILDRQFYCHLGGGATMFVTSWAIFERCTRQPHTADHAAPLGRLVRSHIRIKTLGLALLIVLPVLAVVFLTFPYLRSVLLGVPLSKSPPHESVMAVTALLAFGLPLATMCVARITRKRGRREIGECWSHARSLVWKDLHFVTGGVVGILTRIALYSLLTGLVAFLIGFFDPPDRWEWSLLGGWMLGLGLFAGTLELGSNVGRSLRFELQGQTLSTLVLLPQTIRAFLWSKLVSSLAALIPVAVMTLIGGLLILQEVLGSIFQAAGRSDAGDFMGLLYIPMVITLALMQIALFVELTAYFALTVRWGYVVLAMICTYFMNTIGGFAWSMFMLMFSFAGVSSGADSTLVLLLMTLVPWVTAVGVSLAVVIALFHAIESRIKHLASQS